MSEEIKPCVQKNGINIKHAREILKDSGRFSLICHIILNEVEALRARVRELEAKKEENPLKISIDWGGQKAEVLVEGLNESRYPASLMENEIVKLFRLVVPKPFQRKINEPQEGAKT